MGSGGLCMFYSSGRAHHGRCQGAGLERLLAGRPIPRIGLLLRGGYSPGVHVLPPGPCTASVARRRRSAYRRTNLAGLPSEKSQKVVKHDHLTVAGDPGPDPIVGMSTSAVTRSARTSGTPSSTIAKHPAAARARRLGAAQVAAAAASRPLTLYPPMARNRLRSKSQVAHHRDLSVEDRQHCGTRRRPPSSLTAWAPARTSVAALRMVSLASRWYVSQGRSPTSKRLRSRPRHRRDMVGKVLDPHVESVGLSEHDLGERVPDEDHVDPGSSRQPG